AATGTSPRACATSTAGLSCTAGSTGSSDPASTTCTASSAGSSDSTSTTGSAGSSDAASATYTARSTGSSDTTSATRTSAPQLIRCLPVPIGSVSAVLRVVLPFVALASLAPVDVPVYVFVEIIVVVDVDISAVPIAIAPGAAPSPPSSGPQRNSRAPRQSSSWHVARISVGIIRIGGRSSPVHHSRVVRGHINNLGVRLLNCDHLLAAGDCLGLHYLLCA